jgi:hypothetical protein
VLEPSEAVSDLSAPSLQEQRHSTGFEQPLTGKGTVSINVNVR